LCQIYIVNKNGKQKGKQMEKLTLILLIFVIASCDTIVEFNQDLTKTFSIQSISNGANYNIKVALPENYSPQTQKYAVQIFLWNSVQGSV